MTQQQIKGTERKDAIPELEDAANAQKDMEDKLARQKQQLKDQRDAVNKLLVDNGRQKYVYYVGPNGRTKRTVTYKTGARRVVVNDEEMPPEQLKLKKQPQPPKTNGKTAPTLAS